MYVSRSRRRSINRNNYNKSEAKIIPWKSNSIGNSRFVNSIGVHCIATKFTLFHFAKMFRVSGAKSTVDYRQIIVYGDIDRMRPACARNIWFRFDVFLRLFFLLFIILWFFRHLRVLRCEEIRKRENQRNRFDANSKFNAQGRCDWLIARFDSFFSALIFWYSIDNKRILHSHS